MFSASLEKTVSRCLGDELRCCYVQRFVVDAGMGLAHPKNRTVDVPGQCCDRLALFERQVFEGHRRPKLFDFDDGRHDRIVGKNQLGDLAIVIDPRGDRTSGRWRIWYIGRSKVLGDVFAELLTHLFAQCMAKCFDRFEMTIEARWRVVSSACDGPHRQRLKAKVNDLVSSSIEYQLPRSFGHPVLIGQ